MKTTAAVLKCFSRRSCEIFRNIYIFTPLILISGSFTQTLLIFQLWVLVVVLTSLISNLKSTTTYSFVPRNGGITMATGGPLFAEPPSFLSVLVEGDDQQRDSY